MSAESNSRNRRRQELPGAGQFHSYRRAAWGLRRQHDTVASRQTRLAAYNGAGFADLTGSIIVPGSGETVFDVEERIEFRESQGLKVNELARAEELAQEHKTLIIQKWHEHLD